MFFYCTGKRNTFLLTSNNATCNSCLLSQFSAQLAAWAGTRLLKYPRYKNKILVGNQLKTFIKKNFVIYIILYKGGYIQRREEKHICFLNPPNALLKVLQTVYYFYMRELHGIVWPSECPIACSTIIIYICSLLWHFWLDGGFFNCLQCNAALLASSIKLLMYLLFKSRHTFPGCFVNYF